RSLLQNDLKLEEPSTNNLEEPKRDTIREREQLDKLKREFDTNPLDELRSQIDTTAAALDTVMTFEAQKCLFYAKSRIVWFAQDGTSL
uniref:Uncharacterized protein n=1 Tax=Labrus bergylta TaxID=56723 RepID=A0A3Q3EM33_9LABR